MPRALCFYCEEPFRGDPTVGIVDHTQEECQNEIDDHIGVAVGSLEFPDLSDVTLRQSLERVLNLRRKA